MPVLKTPLSTGEVELSSDGKYYWKQIIPLDYKLDYAGRKLNFNAAYLNDIVNAFKDNALGQQTAFQLADDDNSHDTDADKKAKRHFDPQRFRGDIADVEVRTNGSNPGLWAKFDLTPEGLDLIKKNNKLGVSASLREQYPSHNGKVYPVVLRHVLGTIDPKIRGMGNWEAADVALANDEDVNEEVIDLTTAEKTKDEKTSGEKLEVDKSEWEAMKKFMEDSKKEDEELDELVKNILEDEDDEDEDDKKSNLSNTETDPRIIELSNKFAAEQFERRADAWRREGVPNKMIELARPALATGNAMDIELSNGAKQDGKAILSAMLDEAKGTIDMSAQSSHTQSQDDLDREAQDRTEAAKFFSSLTDDSGGFNGSIF